MFASTLCIGALSRIQLTYKPTRLWDVGGNWITRKKPVRSQGEREVSGAEEASPPADPPCCPHGEKQTLHLYSLEFKRMRDNLVEMYKIAKRIFKR